MPELIDPVEFVPALRSPLPHRKLSRYRSLTQAPGEPPAHKNGGRVSIAPAARLLREERRPNTLPAGDATARLTRSQEIALFQRIEKGDQMAKDALIHANLRLVTSIAQRYQGRGMALEDLIQEGTLGLMHAADKFDWRKGFRFSTYAVHWIRQTILRAIATYGRTIRLPAYLIDAINRLVRLRSKLTNALGRAPTLAELAVAAGMTEQEVTEILQVVAEPASLDARLRDEEDPNLVETIAAHESQSPSARIFQLVLQEEVSHALRILAPREQQVLCLRFGLEGQAACSLEEIGRRLGMTRQRARQIEQQALNKLRIHPVSTRLWETMAA